MRGRKRKKGRGGPFALFILILPSHPAIWCERKKRERKREGDDQAIGPLGISSLSRGEESETRRRKKRKGGGESGVGGA